MVVLMLWKKSSLFTDNTPLQLAHAFLDLATQSFLLTHSA
jgi:hypothetical protein